MQVWATDVIYPRPEEIPPSSQGCNFMCMRQGLSSATFVLLILELQSECSEEYDISHTEMTNKYLLSAFNF